MRRLIVIMFIVVATVCTLVGSSGFITSGSPASHVSLATAAAGDVTTVASSNMITASARGEAEVGPDLATVTMGALVNQTTADGAQAGVRTIMARTRGALHALKVPDTQIQTISIAVMPHYSGKTTITGYDASQTLLVTVDNVQQVGKVVDAAVKAGATNGVRVDYGLRDANAPYLIALTKATRIASSHAAAMAAALGRSLATAKVQSVESGPVVTHRTPLTISAPGGLLDFRVDVMLSYTF